MQRAIQLIAFALLLVSPRGAGAGDPNQVWKTIESEHFVLHYHEPLDDVARRVAVVAERSHRVLAPAMGRDPSGKTQVVILDDTDGSNGFANVIPRNAVRLFVSAPPGLSALGDHDDWLYGLTAHEYTHVLHLDSIGTLPSLYNKLVGKTWAPNQIQPRWVVEGIATYQESKRSSAGRTRHAIFDMELRMATLKEKVRSLDQVSHGPREWPHGNVAYLYGSHFLKYVFDRYGDDKLLEMSWAYGSSPVPYGINRAIERITGKTFVALYDEWDEYRRAKYSMQEEAVERLGRREGRRLTFSGEVNVNPKYSRDGSSLIWQRGDGLSRGHFRSMALDGNIGLSEIYAIVDRSAAYDMMNDGSMVVVQTDRIRNDYTFQELFLWDKKTGALEELTHGARVADPDISPDERRVAMAVNGQSRRQLAVMPLRPEVDPTIVWTGEDRFDQAFSPTWAPDGKSIAFSAWRRGGYRDILILNLESGEVVELAHDRAQDLEPEFDPKGRFLYYSSDRTGIYNIYAYELATAKTYQVTNVLGCALSPAVSPDGSRLAYRGYDYNGYEIYELELDPTTFIEATPHINDRPDPVSIGDDEYEVSKPRPYRALSTLAPQRYTVQLATGSFGDALTVQTSGTDVVGHHSYSLTGTLSIPDGNLNIGAGYSYNRLWPSLRLAMARRASRVGGLRIDDENTTYIEENLAATLSVGLPVLRSAESSGTISLDYDFDWLRNTGDSFGEFDPSATLPGFPESDVRVAGVALRFSYADSRGFVYALGRQEGKDLSVSLRLDHPNLGSDFEALSLSYRWNTYRRLPWGVTPVLALRVAGGLRTTNRRRSGLFAIGGVPNQDLVSSVVDSLRISSTGYLRGFPSGHARGRQFHLANLEYRQEIFEFESGFSSLPLYLRRVHIAGLFDAGNAFNGEIDAKDFNFSVGGSLRLDTVVGYFIPGSFDIGYARGLTEGGINEFWMLLTGTL